MPSKKRANIDIDGIEEKLKIMAAGENRTFSNMCRQLILEAMVNRDSQGKLSLGQLEELIPELPTPMIIQLAVLVLSELLERKEMLINQGQAVFQQEDASTTFIRKTLSGTLTLADLNKTALALDIQPADLQKIKKDNDAEQEQGS